MSTADTARAAVPGHGTPSASRIVRIGQWVWPAAAATLVVVAVRIAVPHGAWLPVPRGASPSDRWQWTLDRSSLWLADLHVAAVGGVTRDVVAGAMTVTAVTAAATTALLAVALRTTGLSPIAATVLALVAASAPLLSWQAGSPFGGALLSLLSAFGLLWVARRGGARHRPHGSASEARAGLGQPALPSEETARPLPETALGQPARPSWAVIAGLIVVGLALWVAGGARDTLARLRLDLGSPGVLLVLASGASVLGSAVRRPRSVWLGLLALLVVTAVFPPHLRAAACLPWTWWVVGHGLARLLDWRGRAAGRWVLVGLTAWVALHAARVPWGQQRQHAALVRTWADGILDEARSDRPVVSAPTAQGRLIDALISSRGEGSTAASVPPTAVRALVRAGRSATVVDLTSRAALQWGGVALDARDGGGVGIDTLLDALPGGTVVLAAVSREAAATLTPLQWQALGRIGLRLADAGVTRAHVVAGVTRARVEALEVGQAGSVRLDLQPGDPLGRTGVRSPIDARLEADGRRVRVLIRDRPFLDERGLALVFFTTRGDLLGWRSGGDGARLDGPPLGGGPMVRDAAIASLPCVELEADRDTDLAPVLATGTLGITGARAPASVTLVGAASDGPLVPAVVSSGEGPDRVRIDAGRTTSTARLTLDTTTPMGLSLRHEGALSARSNTAARVCAAWPLPRTLSLDAGPVDLALLPRHEPLHGRGWHALEQRPGGGYFRWMDGPRATLLLPLRPSGDVRIVLDAQGVRPPEPGDVARLSVGGHPLGDRPLHRTRGLYEWEIPAALLQHGVNVVRLETTATLRPADRVPGADPRRLGLLVYGWTLAPASRTGAQ